jgi:hypothetical protein
LDDRSVFWAAGGWQMAGFDMKIYFTSKSSDFQSQESKNMEIASYPTQMLMLLGTLAIYCFEMFVSFSEFKQFGLTQKEK